MRGSRHTRPLVVLVLLALGGALVPALSRASGPTTSPATTAKAKLSASMQVLLARGGYGAGSAIPTSVDGYRAGDVFYLAQVSGAVDSGTLTAVLRGAGAEMRFRYPSIGWVALVSKIDAVRRVAALSQVTRL